MQCESCRRSLGAEQLDCPRRNQGQENLCPYRVERSKLPANESGWLIFVGLVISLIPVTAILIGKEIPFWMQAALMPFLLIGFYMIGAGTYTLFGKQLTIFNPASGQTWQQTSIFGLPVDRKVSGAIELIPWEGAAARVMRYPPSVTELYRNGKAPEMFSSALLYLAAQGVISIGQIWIYRKLRKPSRLFVLLPGDKFNEQIVNGELEKRIASVVGQAMNEQAVFEFQGKKYRRSQRAVLSLEDVVTMVFEGGKKNPNQFLIRMVVGEEAVALGLGELGGDLIQKFLPGSNSYGKISLDIRSVDQLHRDFWTTQLEYASELLAQIDLLILAGGSSRQE